MKLFRLTALAALAALPALLSAGARAQHGSSSISGMVVYRGGEPANARIYYALQGRYRQTSSRFRGGRNVGYTISGLPLGRYELLVTAPGAKPRRIWGVTLGSFEQKQLNFVLDRCPPREELTYLEEGEPILDDMPRDWQGGWIQGILWNEKGEPVEGVVNFYRGPTVFASIPAGSPTIPAYFESRDIPPGTWDLVFVPTANVRLKPSKIPGVVVEDRARTVLEPVTIPSGAVSDLMVTLPTPKRAARLVPRVARRPRALPQ